MEVLSRSYKLASFILLLLLVSCSREDSVIIDEEGIAGSTSTEVGTVLTVSVKNGSNPIAGAEVTNISQSRTTDENGVAVFQNVRALEGVIHVHVKKEGYHSETIHLPSKGTGTAIHKEVLLISQAQVGFVNTTSNSQDLPRGVLVTVDAGDAVWAPTPVGVVSYLVAVEEYNSDNVLTSQLPLFETGRDRMMVPTHRLRLQAIDSEGSNLSLVNGSSVGITMNIGNLSINDNFEIALQNDSPSPLVEQIDFSFDEAIIKGDIESMGTLYIGDILDVSLAETQVVSSLGDPIVNVEYRLAFDEGGAYSGYTDNTGKIQHWTPIGIEANFTFLQGQTFISQSEKVQSGSTTYIVLDENILSLRGSYTGCIGDMAYEGYVLDDGHVTGIIDIEGDISGSLIVRGEYLADTFFVINTVNAAAYAYILNEAQLADDIDLGIIDLCDPGGSVTTERVAGSVMIDYDDDGVPESVEGLLDILQPVVLAFDEFGILIAETTLMADGTYDLGEFEVGEFLNVEFKFKDGVDPAQYFMYTGFYPLADVSFTPSPGYRHWVVNDGEYDELAIGINGPGIISGKVTFENNGEILALKTEVSLYYDNGPSTQFLDILYTTITDENGNYEFKDIPNRKYSVRLLNIPDDSEVIAYRDDTADAFDRENESNSPYIPVFLQRGEVDDGNNFTVQLNNLESNSFITGSVLVDTDNDGVGDTPYEGEIVRLYQGTSDGFPLTVEPLYETMSLESGLYQFPAVEAGSYVIESAGEFKSEMGSFLNFSRVYDKDDSPELGEDADVSEANGFITVELSPRSADNDNNIVVKFN